jgi:hypothetical protein
VNYKCLQAVLFFRSFGGIGAGCTGGESKPFPSSEVQRDVLLISVPVLMEHCVRNNPNRQIINSSTVLSCKSRTVVLYIVC